MYVWVRINNQKKGLSNKSFEVVFDFRGGNA